jgi:hypothetical protein
MATSVATVAFIQGKVWAKSADGSMRLLAQGDVLNADEVVITAEGARVELDFGDGQAVALAGGQEVGLGPDLWEVSVTDRNEAEIVDESVEQVLALLEQDGDLLEGLEETAAGGNDAGAGGGNSFVQVDRVSLDSPIDPSYAFGDVFRATGTGTLIAEGINQAPEAEDQLISSPEDTPVSGRIIATDLENDTLTWTLQTGPQNGTLTLNPQTGDFIYTPNPDFNGPDSFVVVISDPRGNSTTARVDLDITPVNDAPTSQDLTLVTPEDTPVSGRVDAQDQDGDPLTWVIQNPPTNGSVVIDPNTGEFVYTPNPGYNGGDRFVVIINDGNGGTTTSTVTIGVTPVAEPPVEPPVIEPPVVVINTPPVTNNLNLSTPEDTPVSGRVIASDVDGDRLTFTISGGPANGSITSFNQSLGSFTYQPGPGYTGSDQFTVTVSDGRGGFAVAVVTIGVTPDTVTPPVNTPPVALDDAATTDQDQAVTINVRVNDTDADGDTLTVTAVTQGANGSVAIDPVSGNPTYTPNNGYVGSDTFTYTVSDGNGGTSTATVTVTVNAIAPVNEAPVAVNDPAGSPYTVALGTAATGTSGASASWKTATDSTGAAVNVTAYNANNTVGKLIFDGLKMGVEGTPRTIPTWAREEPKQIEYDVTTGKSESVVIELNGNVTSAVFGVANLIHNEQGGAEQGVWTAYYKGNVVASESFHLVGKSAGDITVNTGGKVFDSIRFSALDNLNNTGAGDGSGYYLTSFTASGSAAANSDYTVNTQGKLTVSAAKGLLVNDTDADGDALVVNQINGGSVVNGEIVTLSGGALLTINSDGSFSYDANGKFSTLSAGSIATESFDYQVSDGNGGYANATATITVIGTAALPVSGLSQGNSLGAETFAWTFGEQGEPGNPEKDILSTFRLSDKDVLDLSDLLQGETIDTLNNYLHFSVKGTTTEVHISSGGNYQNGFDATQTDQIIVLQNVTLNTQMPYKDLIQQLTSGGNLITD